MCAISLSNYPTTVTVVQYDKSDGRHRQEQNFHIYTAMRVLYAFVVCAPTEPRRHKSFDSYSDARILNRLTCLHVNIRIHKHLSAKGRVQGDSPITRRKGFSSQTPSPQESTSSTFTHSLMGSPHWRFQLTRERALHGRYPLEKI